MEIAQVLASSFNFKWTSEADFVAGCTLLFACAKNDIGKVKDLLASNARLLHFADYDMRTALHVASSEGHLDLVIYLLDQGAK